MILDPDVKRILCFGDSNTWGQSDDKNYASRYGLDVRWPGRLQKLLGDGYEVYEEGLGSRNTNMEHYDKANTFHNGLRYFMAYVQTHPDLEVVVLMLGTNDLKIQYKRSVHDVAAALQEYIDVLTQKLKDAHIILVSPPVIDTNAPKFESYYRSVFDQASAEKSQQLGAALEALAAKCDASFLDASKITEPGGDGLHLTEEGHLLLADEVAFKVKGARNERE